MWRCANYLFSRKGAHIWSGAMRLCHHCSTASWVPLWALQSSSNCCWASSLLFIPSWACQEILSTANILARRLACTRCKLKIQPDVRLGSWSSTWPSSAEFCLRLGARRLFEGGLEMSFAVCRPNIIANSISELVWSRQLSNLIIYATTARTKHF